MKELHLPWLELAIFSPLLGAILVGRLRDPHRARIWCMVFTGISFLCSAGAWQDFQFLHATQAEDHWHWMGSIFGRELFVIDQVSAPLLPMTALLYFLTALATLRTTVRKFSFAWTLLAESMVLAMYSCQEPWMVVGLLTAGTLPPYRELRARGAPTRVYVTHMGLFVVLMVAGWAIVSAEGVGNHHSLVGIMCLLMAVLIRSGIVPFHCWVPDLFENATFGSALLFVTPIVGAYGAVRLVLPIAPDWVLRSMGVISLITAVYAAGMALVQKEGRRFFSYLFLSHSALVLVGLEMVTPIGLTGAFCIWLSVSLAMGGFGLTLRALEARRGRLSLMDFQGLYEHTPNLAMCFAITGLAAVGFPGTLGFVGAELLVDGAVATYPFVGVAVVLAAALNGIAIVTAYLRLFTGVRYSSSVSLKIRVRERYAVLALTALILIGGMLPQDRVALCHHAAEELLRVRSSHAKSAVEHAVSTEPEAAEESSAEVSARGKIAQEEHADHWLD
ncbi:MAG: proton-conducting transporter membrane subunit [Planctomycetota bacterium]